MMNRNNLIRYHVVFDATEERHNCYFPVDFLIERTEQGTIIYDTLEKPVLITKTAITEEYLKLVANYLFCREFKRTYNMIPKIIKFDCYDE